ncbi:MAG: excinuclease ABC subunit UvrA [Simkaniaceae bacterium]|nr:MAG: excinuclease ABC subunit UvrA [Simkaniaceae bacterium]
MEKQSINLKNVRVHNLKGVNLKLDPGTFIVFTGVSGSGKSSLAFDTIYVEGQRRYIESLSNYARRYMGNLTKPDADLIEGISPTIAIEQKTAGRNPRSTVGTITGIYDYLRVLFARVGTPHCPVSGEKVEPQSTERILSTIQNFQENSQLIFLAPHTQGKKGEFKELFEDLVRKGFMRIRLDGEIVDLEDEIEVDKSTAHDIDLVIDRIVLKNEEKTRITEAVTQALELGEGLMTVLNKTTKEEILFSQHAYAKKSKLSYNPLEPHDFSFNHPKGMCPTCEGLGITQDYDLDKIIDPEKSISEDCCLVASSYSTVKWGNVYNNVADLYGFDVDTPWKDLSESAKKQFLYGNKKKWTKMAFVHPHKKGGWVEYIKWRGVLSEAKKRYNEAKSDVYRTKMEKLMHETVCPECHGSRIKPYPSATKIGNKTIHQVTLMTIEELQDFFQKLKLSPFEEMIGHDLILEIKARLEFLLNVGLYYLTIDRTAPTLSGGEAQRVRLASQIGCGLVGTTYILDEPSIGLHPRDNTKLITTLEHLRDRGNTIIVVEHDEETMEAADYIVDIGPEAGSRGGEVVAAGTIEDLEKAPRSITGAYLSGKEKIPIPKKPRKKSDKLLTIQGAQHHNLKKVTVDIPLGLFVAVTGVSGSGKSSLITDILYPALANNLHRAEHRVGKHKAIMGIEHLDKVIAIDQTPIGRTPRSNPSTYIKVFDDIRDLFTKLPESQAAGFKPGRFSFNVKEGSCTECGGMGQIRLDMDFMDDVWTTCSLCDGKRFDPKTLSITYKGKNIHDVLEMTVEKALEFFEAIPQIHHKLSLLKQVGMDYITLGQSSTTLSGGEAQRIKLAREIIRPATGKTLYILDEPTTGLHFHDIRKLIGILQHLVDAGNTVLVIEHNIDLIKTTDWIIDLGPEGGKGGGQILGAGTPKQMEKKETPTGLALRPRNKPKSRPHAPAKKPLTTIHAKGCSQNNLKGIDLEIPRGKISVCTGPSGSGKSSFAFDTIYAEGQRRYIESLSSYARQFVKQMSKPKVEEIDGLSPAIAIEQKHHAGNPRSTIGTMTEIYDFLRLLYAHSGVAYCPETGEKIESISKEYVVDHLMELPEKTRLHILTPIKIGRGQSIEEVKDVLIQQGFVRIRLNGEYYEFDEEIPFNPNRKNTLFLVVDRLAIRPGVEKRLFEAIEQATLLTKEPFTVATQEKDLLFNLAFAVPSTGKTYPPLTPHTFSFNAEEGMCPDCLGLGFQWGANVLHHQKIMALSPYTLISKLWKEEATEAAEDIFLTFLEKEEIDPDTPLYKLPIKELQLILNGSKVPFKYDGMELTWIGVNQAFSKIAKTGKKQQRETIQHLLETSPCMSCQGDRLNPLARGVKLQGKTIGTLCNLPLSEALAFVKKLPQKKHLKDIIDQLTNRLTFLNNIGLEYLSLSRSAPTLSGGETQRIHLARQLGSGLTGCLYVLDEPTIGLHPHNNERLNEALKHLRDLGNTLLMVEHDPLTLQIADHLFDFGPKAGRLGGELMAQGTLSQIKKNKNSLTGAYLSGKKKLPIPEKRRTSKTFLTIEKAKKHNLKNITVKIPTKTLTCISGVSGSGKSTLIDDLLKKGVQSHLASRSDSDELALDGATIKGLSAFNKLIAINQNPIGTTIRADVSTYTEINAPLRHFFASLPEAAARGLKPKHFSYNHLKGMCMSCWGLGFKTIRLQFLPSLRVKCDACNGNRLKPLSLKVSYKGKNLGQLLRLTVEEATTFLPPIPKLQNILETLISVGLGYLTLGQEIQSLSGGEAGRIRLARELSKRSTGKTLYLFDEPTIGLHSDDIAKLLPIFNALVDKGNTAIIIEHNLDILAAADHLIDLGPGAGAQGGEIIASGTPEELSKSASSLTGKYLAKIL